MVPNVTHTIIRITWNCTTGSLDYYFCRLKLLGAYPSGHGVCGRWFAGIKGWNPAGDIVSCECCVLSGRGLCVGLINHPEESYRAW
jgi:hypothetical protein